MRFKIWLAILSAVFVFLSVHSAWHESLTFDEIVYIQESWQILVNHRFAVYDPYNPPFLKELIFWPLVLGFDRFIPSDMPSRLALPGRIVPILLSVLLSWTVYRFVKKNVGGAAGLAAVFWLVFEPTFLGHSHYLTFDTGLAAVFFGSYVLFVEWLSARGGYLFISSFVALGLTLASRISGLPYWFAAVVPAYIFEKRYSVMRAMDAKKVILGVLTVSLTVWATYGWQWGLIIPPGLPGQERLSANILAAATASGNKLLVGIIKFAQNEPVPLGHFLALIKSNLLRGALSDSSWLLMAWVLFVKLPLPMWLSFGLGGYILWQKNRRAFVLLALPAVSLLLTAMLLRVNPLVRYLTPAIIFIAMTAGVGSVQLLSSGWRRVVFVLLTIWMVITVVSQQPHYISYANVFAGPRQARYAHLTDANLDWGQGLITLKKYIDTTQPRKVSFSYFGRDDGAGYGFVSGTDWGSHLQPDICAFHELDFPAYHGPELVIISATNWRTCGYDAEPRYAVSNVREVVGDVFLVF